MATTRKENEGAIQAFKQAQARLGLPVILTRNCAKVRDDAKTQIQLDFDAAIDRMKKKSKACMDSAQENFDFNMRVYCRLGAEDQGYDPWSDDSYCTKYREQWLAELHTAQTDCINQARDERAAAVKDAADRSLQVSLDYALCCINNPGSCVGDAGTPEA